MKLKIGKAFEDGYNVLINNPVLFFIGFVYAVIIKLLEPQMPHMMTNYRMVMDYFTYGGINLIAIVLLGGFLNGMIIVLSAKGKKFSVGSALNLVASRFIVIVLASIIAVAIISLGLVVLIIPGIFLAIRLLFYDQAILLNNQDVVESLKMSWNVTKGNWWRIFALVILIALVTLIISLPISIFNKILADFVASTFVVPWAVATYTKAYLQLKR